MEKEDVILKLQGLLPEDSPLKVEKRLKEIAKTSNITLKTLKEELEILKDKERKKKFDAAQEETKKFLEKLEISKISVSVEDYLKCKYADCLRLLEYYIVDFNRTPYLNWKEKHLEFKEFKIVVKLINEEYKEEEQLAQAIQSYYDKSDLALKIWEVQPYFYDKNRLWWLWDNKEKYWRVVDDTSMLVMVKNISLANTVKATEKAEIIEAMKQYGRERIPKEIKKTWIQFKDMIVDIKTGEEFKVSPEYFATNPIPYPLHKERFVNTHVMDRIFEEWVGPKYVKTLYEIIAYCLIPDYPLHRLFCFIGAGLNGKGKFLELMRKFIGPNNVCSTELDTLLDSRFEITRLHKKLMCQMGETNFNEMKKTSILKKLVGGDLIGYEYKNKDPFNDLNYAKIIIATNNLPTTSDKTIGFYRRWLIIDFPNQFSEKKDILKEIPEEEYEILAVKSLIILKDLLNNREFHNEGSIEQRMKKYEDHSDPLEKFLKEYTEEDHEGFIWKHEFEKKLNEWCIENRFRQMSEVVIGKKMKEKGIIQDKKQATWFTDGVQKRYRAWVSIKWKEGYVQDVQDNQVNPTPYTHGRLSGFYLEKPDTPDNHI